MLVIGRSYRFSIQVWMGLTEGDEMITGELEDYHEAICSVFAICWNLAIRKHPQSIIDDFEKFMNLIEPPRMSYIRPVHDVLFAVLLGKRTLKFVQL